MSNKSELRIHQGDCISCGICVGTCPAKVFKKCDNHVLIDSRNEIFCINCGDCTSVCPKEAIKSENLFTEEVHDDYINLKPEQLLNFFKIRRTVRSYKPVNLSVYEKDYLAQVAALTPKGGHTQSIRNTGIIIVENKELIEKIIDYTYEYIYALKKKISSVWVGIPKAFNPLFRDNINNTMERIDSILKAKEQNINMLTYDSANLVLLHNENNSPISRENLTIMEYQLMLGAEVLNLGTCFLGWVSFAMQSYKVGKSNELKLIYDMLGIPKGREISGVFSIGRKNSNYKKLKVRDKATINSITD